MGYTRKLPLYVFTRMLISTYRQTQHGSSWHFTYKMVKKDTGLYNCFIFSALLSRHLMQYSMFEFNFHKARGLIRFEGIKPNFQKDCSYWKILHFTENSKDTFNMASIQEFHRKSKQMWLEWLHFFCVFYVYKEKCEIKEIFWQEKSNNSCNRKKNACIYNEKLT